MPMPTKGPSLGSGPAHQRLMLANLATALFQHGRITTTEAKAKRLRPLAERLVTFAKRGDLNARRQALTVVRDKGVVQTLFSEIGPRYETRNGGYTRITKIGPRRGDNAPMAMIELVEGAPADEATRSEPARPRTGRGPAAGTGMPAAREATDTGEAAASGETAGSEETEEEAQEAQRETAPEAGEAPAEGASSPQTAGADERGQAEGNSGDEPPQQDTR